MGLLSFFSNKTATPVEKKSTTDRMLGWLNAWTIGGNSVSNDMALQVPAVFCAVRVISEGVSAMPIVLKERNMSGKGRWKTRPVGPGHWAQKLMSVKPNGWQTPAEFIEGMTICAALSGEALAVKNVVRGEVRELLPVPPGCWSVEQDSSYRLRYRIDYENRTHGYFDQSQVMVLRGPTLNGYNGLPVVRYAAKAIGLASNLQSQQSRMAEKHGQPSGILSTAVELDDESRENLRDVWEAKFGPNGDGGIAVLDGGWEFSSLTMTSVDAQVMESRRFQVEEIARAFRVLPLKLMQADKAATFASVEQMQRIHVLETLMPWVRRWESVLQRDVLASDATMLFDFEEEMLMRGDHKDQAEFYQKALGAGGVPGFMTVNEVREEYGRPPINEPWADEIPRGSQSENLQNAPSPSQDAKPAVLPGDEADDAA